MSENLREMTQEEKVHDARQQVDRVLQYVLLQKNDTRYTKGQREYVLSYTKLQEAKMWLGKVLEELGSELPAQYRDEAK